LNCILFIIYYNIYFPAPSNRQETAETRSSRQETSPFKLIVPSLSPRRQLPIEELQYGETLTSGMIRGAILEHDARSQHMPTEPLTSRRRTSERPSSRRQVEERSHKRSRTPPPYRRQFGIYRNEMSSTSYRSPLDFRDRRLGRDERSGTPWQYRSRSRNFSPPAEIYRSRSRNVSPPIEIYRSRSRNVSPPVETRDSSLNEGEYNLLQKLASIFLINFLLTFLRQSLLAWKN
jgi:hypothetical protein